MIMLEHLAKAKWNGVFNKEAFLKAAAADVTPPHPIPAIIAAQLSLWMQNTVAVIRSEIHSISM